MRITRGILEKSIWRAGVGLDQSGGREIKRSTFEIFCEGRNHRVTDGVHIEDEEKGEVPGLSNCMKCNPIY